MIQNISRDMSDSKTRRRFFSYCYKKESSCDRSPFRVLPHSHEKLGSKLPLALAVTFPFLTAKYKISQSPYIHHKMGYISQRWGNLPRGQYALHDINVAIARPSRRVFIIHSHAIKTFKNHQYFLQHILHSQIHHGSPNKTHRLRRYRHPSILLQILLSPRNTSR